MLFLFFHFGLPVQNFTGFVFFHMLFPVISFILIIEVHQSSRVTSPLSLFFCFFVWSTSGIITSHFSYACVHNNYSVPPFLQRGPEKFSMLAKRGGLALFEFLGGGGGCVKRGDLIF